MTDDALITLDEYIIAAIRNSHCSHPPIVMRSKSPPRVLWLAMLIAVSPPDRNTMATEMKEYKPYPRRGWLFLNQKPVSKMASRIEKRLVGCSCCD